MEDNRWEKIDPLGQYRDLETCSGSFNKRTILDFLKYFCIFIDNKEIIKIALVTINFMQFKKHLKML